MVLVKEKEGKVRNRTESLDQKLWGTSKFHRGQLFDDDDVMIGNIAQKKLVLGEEEKTMLKLLDNR